MGHKTSKYKLTVSTYKNNHIISARINIQVCSLQMPSWTRALECVELSSQGFMEDTADGTQWQGLVRKVTQWQFS
jgi:hypothetical protein